MVAFESRVPVLPGKYTGSVNDSFKKGLGFVLKTRADDLHLRIFHTRV